MDVISVSGKTRHYISLKTKYLYLSNINIFPILCFSSSRAADCRLNIGHAGVLLVERRGSYPLIDLRILKSNSFTSNLLSTNPHNFYLFIYFFVCVWGGLVHM